MTTAPTTAPPAGATDPRAARRPRRRLRLTSNRKARVGLAVLALYAFVAVLGPTLVTHLLHQSPTALTPDVLAPPSSRHWLGTNQDGVDVLAQLVWGTRASLLVGLIAAATSTVLAVLVGLVGGYYGGVVDQVLGAVTNVFLVLPGLPLVIVLAGYLQGRGGSTAVALVIGFTGWAWGARSKRIQTVSLRSRDFVTNAKLMGERDVRIMTAEILPNLLPVISSTLMLAVVTSILAVSGLEFLGIGDVNTVSWGSMLRQAQERQALFSGAWWWFVPPGAAITLLGAAAGLVNFGVDEITNPRLRVRRPRRTKGAAR